MGILLHDVQRSHQKEEAVGELVRSLEPQKQVVAVVAGIAVLVAVVAEAAVDNSSDARNLVLDLAAAAAVAAGRFDSAVGPVEE